MTCCVPREAAYDGGSVSRFLGDAVGLRLSISTPSPTPPLRFLLFSGVFLPLFLLARFCSCCSCCSCSISFLLSFLGSEKTETGTGKTTSQWHTTSQGSWKRSTAEPQNSTSHRLTTHALKSFYFTFSRFYRVANKIKDEGAKAIGEALKTNTTLTKLNLSLAQRKERCLTL